MRRVPMLIAVVGFAMSACGGSAGDGNADTGVELDSPEVSDTAATDVTEARDEPAAGPVLVFEDIEIEEDFIAAIPVGWVQDEFLDQPGKFEAPEDAGFDRYQLPEYWVSQQCAGSCVVRSSPEWAMTIEQSLFSSYRRPEMFKVVRDEVGEGFALLETVNVGERTWTDLQIARWADGQEKVITCLVTLHEDNIDLMSQFEDACTSITASVLPSG